MRNEGETTSQPEEERSLDRLLNEARWPDADPAAMPRLRTTLASQSIQTAAKPHPKGFWPLLPVLREKVGMRAFRLFPTPYSGHKKTLTLPSPGVPGEGFQTKSRRGGWLRIAIAASIGIALIGAVIFLLPRHNPPQIAHLQSASMVVAAHAVSPIISRPANEYERAILLANSMAHSAAQPAPVPPPIAPVASSVPKNGSAALLEKNDPASIEAYLKLVQNQSTRDAALDALRNCDHPPMQLLLAELNAPLVSRRYAAARALGCLCHGPTFKALQQMVERNIDRREAMIALLYCPNPAAKEYLSQLRTRPVLSETLKAVQSQMQTIF